MSVCLLQQVSEIISPALAGSKRANCPPPCILVLGVIILACWLSCHVSWKRSLVFVSKEQWRTQSRVLAQTTEQNQQATDINFFHLAHFSGSWLEETSLVAFLFFLPCALVVSFILCVPLHYRDRTIQKEKSKAWNL